MDGGLKALILFQENPDTNQTVVWMI